MNPAILVNSYLIFVGLYVLIYPVVRLFRPQFGFSQKVWREIESLENKRGYLIWNNINSFLLSGSVFAAVFLPDKLRIPCIMPVIGCIVISCLVCNKKHFGVFWVSPF